MSTARDDVHRRSPLAGAPLQTAASAACGFILLIALAALGALYSQPSPENSQTAQPSTRDAAESARLGCGPAALLAVARAVDPSAGQALLANMQQSGLAYGPVSSLADLDGAAQRAGLRTLGLKGPEQALDELPLPAVAHLSPGHFVALWEVHEHTVVISEGAEEKRTVSREQFTQRFSGCALAVRI